MKKLNYMLSDWFLFKDTHREKAPSNKIPTLSKTMNIDIWEVGTSIQLKLKQKF